MIGRYLNGRALSDLTDSIISVVTSGESQSSVDNPCSSPAIRVSSWDAEYQLTIEPINESNQEVAVESASAHGEVGSRPMRFLYVLLTNDEATTVFATSFPGIGRDQDVLSTVADRE